MVYCIQSKIQIEGTLNVCRSLHVGGFGTSTNVDLPLATNGQGQVYIPGTSLAGALRGWMSRVCDPDEVNALWGWQDPDSSKERGHASRVFVEDAPVTLDGNPMTLKQMEIRSGVGIERHRGAAAENYLYNRGVIPRGAKLKFDMSAEILEAEQSVTNAIDSLLLAMTSEDIRLGAAKSRGLGRVRLSDVKCLKSGQSDRAGMLAFLKYKSNANGTLPKWQPPSELQHKQVPRIRITLDWKPIGPLMVKSALTGDVVDILPLMGRTDGEQNLAFLLPGSSIKGALKSQAERIVRTVLNRPLPKEVTDLKQQMDLPLIRELFGWTTRETASNNGARQNGKMGALFIEDCFSDTKHPLETLQKLSQVPKDNPDELRDVLNETGLTNNAVDSQVAYHVAVDRWTGGAAEGFLYTNLEPFDLPWEPIELAVDLGRLKGDAISDEDTQIAAVALLLLLMRDVSDKRIPLGYGTNRGMGTAVVTNAEFEVQGTDSDTLKKLNDTSWTAVGDKPLSFDESFDSGLLESLNKSWGKWLQLPDTEKEETKGDSENE